MVKCKALTQDRR